MRDALRIENVKLRQKSGLLGNEPLLRDYEVRKEQVSKRNGNTESELVLFGLQFFTKQTFEDIFGLCYETACYQQKE